MQTAARVVVFGGSGFVGSAVLASLLRAGLKPVSAQRRARAAADGIEQHRCDATDARAVLGVLQGADAAVNAVLGDADTMMAATRAVAEAAGRLSLPLVHLSSMAVYGAHAGRIDEAAPLRGTGGYAEAKIECESALAGTEAVILRPGIVYGPGGEQWAGRIFRLLRARRLGDLGENGDGRCNFVHARDVGAAVIAALGTPLAAGRAINLAHDCAPRWNTVFAACARAIGAVPVPRIAAWQLAAEARVLAPPLFLARHAAGRFSPCSLRLPDAITPSMCSLFRGDFTLDAGLANRLLGLAWVPPAEGLGECATWFLETHGFPMAV